MVVYTFSVHLNATSKYGTLFMFGLLYVLIQLVGVEASIRKAAAILNDDMRQA